MDCFSRDYISSLKGCWALEFLHALEINQGLLTHTRRGTGSPPQKKKSWKLKMLIKIQRARVHNFRDSGSIFTKLFYANCHYCERNFFFLKLLCTRTGGAGRPHVLLCHALLVFCLSLFMSFWPACRSLLYDVNWHCSCPNMDVGYQIKWHTPNMWQYLRSKVNKM